MQKGKFIVLSGIEGSGKKTCFNVLRDVFRRDTSIIFVNEFSSSERTATIRAFAGYFNLTSFEQIQIYIATRSIFIREVVLPAIESGVHVVCNKSAEMTWAKQVFAQDRQEEIGNLFWHCLDSMMHGIMPDMYIDFRIDPKVGLLRHYGLEDGEEGEFEEGEVARNQKIREGIDNFFYLTKAKTIPVDAMKPPLVLHEEVKALIQNFFSK